MDTYSVYLYTCDVTVEKSGTAIAGPAWTMCYATVKHSPIMFFDRFAKYNAHRYVVSTMVDTCSKIL